MTEVVFVFDTNALISAFLLSKSVSAEALNRALRIGSLVFSNSTLSEFTEEFSRDKFNPYIGLDHQRILTLEKILLKFKVCDYNQL